MIQQKIAELIKADSRAYKQLLAVKETGPKGAYIAAGFVRNRVWDSLYTPTRTFPEADVDVVYFCPSKIDPEQDYHYEAALGKVCPDAEWQVRNQARMHTFGGYDAFTSLEGGLLHWPETATAIGVRLDEAGAIDFIAPYGFDDLESHTLRMTPPAVASNRAGFQGRITSKGWLKRWPNLQVIG